MRHLELHVAQRNIERSPFLIMNGESNSETQVRTVFELRESPALAVKLDGGEQEIGVDQDHTGDVELEFRLRVNFAGRVDNQTAVCQPIDVNAGHYGAFEAQRRADFQRRRGADNRNSDA